MSKTIFITSFHPLISRNILATGLLRRLGVSGVGVVILAPKKKQDFLQEEFTKTGVIVEGLKDKVTKRESLLRYLALAALKTRTLAIKRRTEMKGSGLWLAPFIANRAFTAGALRFLSGVLTPYGEAATLFKRYQPAVLFAADIQNEYDVRFIHAAKARGIPVVGMVRSWDNLTAKGFFRAVPEQLVVQNEVIKREAVTLQRFAAEKISVIGIPHYDGYLALKPSPREEFCRRIGADPYKRLILFAPTGDRYIVNNTVDAAVLGLLDAFLPPECQIVVRFPPADSVRGLDGRPNTKRLVFDRPSKRFSSLKVTELTAREDRHLVDTLAHVELVVIGPSTLVIDAAFFDKPVILVGFDGDGKRPYYESVRRYYDYDHFAPVLKTGGARLVESPETLKEALAEYLADPGVHREGRERIVTLECGPTDARATGRLAEIILSYL